MNTESGRYQLWYWQTQRDCCIQAHSRYRNWLSNQGTMPVLLVSPQQTSEEFSRRRECILSISESSMDQTKEQGDKGTVRGAPLDLHVSKFGEMLFRSIILKALPNMDYDLVCSFPSSSLLLFMLLLFRFLRDLWHLAIISNCNYLKK